MRLRVPELSMSSSSPHCRVFVYGTLLEGEVNHHVLRGARCVGRGRTLAAFELVDLGPYPGLVDGGSRSVVGEVYEVDCETLRTLDHFEDHPRLYRRTTITLSDGSRVETYVLPDRPGRGAVIESGNWRDRRGA